jgi:hypothetical protein
LIPAAVLLVHGQLLLNFVFVCLQWEKTDDKPAIATLVVAGLITLWASFALVNVSDMVY